ncbi:hypothetical protein [Alicyclobacillus dauci]|uniref:Uncharacterized protein n=1 Tax=Alicyclobacillus dauci TaxID=1475485 RepID=A0ABY6YXJ8_9BACL|nr:hypothetical protein [Alicyclobacillus dauci]WAH35092.1 hypothetical protein NZD86_12230 [Alicyclobacillus dauci]
MDWHQTLIFCSVLLLLPRFGLDKRFHLIGDLVIVGTIICVTLLHALVPSPYLMVGPIVLSAVRALHLHSVHGKLQGIVQGGLTAIFHHQCQRLYPFATLCGISSGVVGALVIALLLMIFAGDLNSMWCSAGIFYLGAFCIELWTGVSVNVLHLIGLFWALETALASIHCVRMGIRAFNQRSRHKIV